MARRNAWNSGEIDELPAEILSFDIKEIPRATLKDIANKLNADTISAGNWETLAEKLGFTKNSILDNLTQQAKVQNTYPGLLMLQEWSRRSGSTAHVLLHALREIQREDAVVVLVEKLFELHTMQLLVRVQDGERSPKFLRVPTQKSAPLHASLDNTLQKPPYWYDIVGPRCDIDWNSPSGILQGAQLSLRLRVEPSENSMSMIYGTSARLCQPPPSNALALNIPPDPHLPSPQDNGKSLLNNLSNNPQSGPRRDGNLSAPPPPLCLPLQATAMCAPMSLQPTDSILYGSEPLTSIAGPARSDCQQLFPNFDTLMSSSFELTAPPLSVSSLQNSTHNNMEYHPCSCTGVKMPVEPQEHDETGLKERVKPVHEKMNIPVAGKVKSSPEDMNIGGDGQEEMGLAEGVQFTDSGSKYPVTASSFMHTMYISHKAAIQFCNNPNSPQSLDSNSSSLGSAGGPDVRPQFVLEASSSSSAADVVSSAGQQQGMLPEEIRRLVSSGEYVPVHFLENMGKSPQANEEESMQMEYSDSDHHRSTSAMDIAGDSGMQQEPDTYRFAGTAPASGYTSMSRGKPKPCTYTMYRPDMDNSQQFRDFQPRPIPHSVSLDSDPGYLDMRGGHSVPQEQHTTTTSAALAGMHSCLSMDSYMNTQADLGLQNPGTDHLLDNGARNMYAPNLDPLLLSRSRNPLPIGGGNVFQPRDRRPLTQEQELLLDQVDDPEPEYTYIDAASVSPHADLPRRSSEGVLSSEGARYQPSSRGRVFRHRNSEGKLGHRGSVSPAELQQIPGWNAHITERTVDHEMSRYINDDGNFVVWRYDVGCKYVISVSHLRIIRHYAVYESEREGKVYYYIFPKGARFTSLGGLLRHCQEHGVAEPTKTFKTPDGKQAHRSSGNSGGFSHVRLKFPIPARRN